VAKPVELILDIDPVACPRPRVGKHGTYYPKRYTQFKEEMTVLLLRSNSLRKLEGKVQMDVWFKMPMPKSWSKAKRTTCFDTWHTQKPDLDNLVKSLLDCLNGRLFEDDSQVCSLHARKIWSDRGGISFDAWEIDE